MQQPNERTPEFQGVDTRFWVSFSRLAERWERAHNLDRSDMLYEILQGYLRGELWPTILPEVYGGTAITASPSRPDWMKSPRRWPVETFTRLNFLRAAKAFAGLHLYFLPESIKADEPYAAGRRGLIGISLDKYSDLFIESYIKKLTPSPSAVVRWCSDHGWPIPPGLSYPETDVGAVGQDAQSHANPAKETGRERQERWVEDIQQLRQSGRANTFKEAAKVIAGKEKVDFTYVLREDRRIRKEREEKRGK